MRGALLTGVIVLACSALTACSTSPGPPIDYGGDVIDVSRNSDQAPEAFRTRTALPTCGDVTLGQGEGIPVIALQCLEAARGIGGELAVSRPTTEGDPVVTFYRVGAEIEGVEMFTDASRDRFGSDDWSTESCDPDTFIDSYGICVDVAPEE